MKKVLLLMLTALSLVMVGCEKPSNNEDPANPTGKGGIIKFAIEASSPWEVSISNKDGVSVTPTKGQAGKTEVTVTIGERAYPDYPAINKSTISFNNNATVDISSVSKIPLLENASLVTIEIDGCNDYFTAQGFTEGLSSVTINKHKKLSKVDVSNCKSLCLISIEFLNNDATEMDVNLSGTSIKSFVTDGSMAALYYINLHGLNIKSVDLSKNPHLTTIDISEQKGTTIKNIKIDDCANLEYLDMGGAQRNQIELSNYPNLKLFNCNGSGFTSLDVSSNPLLKTLNCSNNPNLTELFLKTGQNIPTLKKDNQTVIKYK